MYKIILITFVLGCTFCDHQNENHHQQRFGDLSQARQVKEVKHHDLLKDRVFKEALKHPDREIQLIKVKTRKIGPPKPRSGIDFQDFLAKIKEEVEKYSKQMKRKNLTPEDEIDKTNIFVDKVISQLQIAIFRDVEPIKLPDLNESFEYGVSPFKATGKLTLTNGNLTQVSTLARERSVQIRKSRNIHVKIPLIIREMAFEFDYLAKVLGIGPTGKLVGTIEDFKADFKLTLNLRKKVISKAQMVVRNRGQIFFELKGGLINNVLNVLKSVVSIVLDRVLFYLYNDWITGEIKVIVEEVNEMIQEIVNVV